METAIAYPHIAMNPEVRSGRPIIEGTRIAVQDIVEYYEIYHDADRIQQALRHLKLAEIFSALSYYHDHKEAIDCEIKRSKDPARLKDMGVRIFSEEYPQTAA